MLAALALVAFTVATAAFAVTMTVTTAFALMAFTMATAAFTVAVTALALVLTLTVVLAVALAIIAVAAATAATGAAYLLVHGVGHLLIGGSAALLDGDAEVLVHDIEHFVELLASLKESLADGVVNHVLTQTVESRNFLLRRGHALHVLVAEFLAILVDLAEKVSGFGVLVEKADASASGNDLLALSNGIGQFSSELHQFGRKGCI